MQNKNNPFYGKIYRGPKFFCDRKEETKLLTNYITNGVNITLFAKRRLGKTGLLHHLFYQQRNNTNMVCIYVDVLATHNLVEFTNYMATAVYNAFPPQKTLGKKIMELFQRFRPTISFDELTGNPSLNLTITTPDQKNNTIGNILNFLDNQNIKIVFAIDEFQQILEYPEKNTEAILRTHIQQLKNTSFIFCGSNQKMMHEIFNSAKRPFFASCTSVSLEHIPATEYKKFIKKHFNDVNRVITDECLNFICDWTQLHTFYTQYFCYTLFALNKENNGIEEAKTAAQTILKLNENTFYQYKNLLTDTQWNFLVAVGKETQVHQPTAKKFITTHQLGTPSSINRSLEALLTKEMLFHNTGVETPYYEVYDKYLMRWMQLNY
ncbi:MAG: ATP-binding protein [Flavobacteriales bacterium]|jgi:AAA+ ATPase superfamily predicted ATPase|nr:ATP-binding protein [Flavobacteriales bacterium]MCB9365052.1 ATP-binding protein [Flavobacteriales bacterium]